ncbi:MAG: 30S ribosomal protein S16 [Opitutaceae bacterium]|nr:30S ribosomal protein S16 [Opitutaceae bacterium]
MKPGTHQPKVETAASAHAIPTARLTTPAARAVVLGFSRQESLRKTSDMALKIRLTKVGSVHQPLYRVVVAEARSRRDGAAVENLGTYRPGDKGNPIKINMERVEYWLSKGAKPTDTMHAMIKKARRTAAAKTEAPAKAEATVAS